MRVSILILSALLCIAAAAWLTLTRDDTIASSEYWSAIGKHRIFLTFASDTRSDRLLHVIIVPAGVTMPIKSSYGAGRFRLSRVPVVPLGIHTRAAAIYLNGVRTVVDPENRIFVLSKAGKWIVVPIPDARLKSIRQPGIEQLQQLPEWKTSIASAIEKATAS